MRRQSSNKIDKGGGCEFDASSNLLSDKYLKEISAYISDMGCDNILEANDDNFVFCKIIIISFLSNLIKQQFADDS